jgi:choline dehydrogenase-like flavoprotein
MMIKLADSENGAVSADGTVTKELTQTDRDRLESAKVEAKRIMEASGVSGPYVDGLVHGGHLGGTVPLSSADVSSMHPSVLPDGLWVADLSLLPHSQGLPTMLTTMALSLRVTKKILEENTKR